MTVVLHRDSIDYFCPMDLSVTAYIVLLPWDTAPEPILYLLTQCLCVKFSFPTTQRNHWNGEERFLIFFSSRSPETNLLWCPVG